jgi:hypothetical protein
MQSDYYDFFDELILEIRGEGGRSTGQFRTMYDHFAVREPDRDPDIVVERTTEDLSVETVLGDPNDHYAWTGDRFVVRSGAEYMAVEPGWDHIYVTPDWEPFYAIYPVEFHLRRNVAADGRALVHASGVELDGTTTLFPAWRGAGKTNTLLSLLRAGGNFLADDRLWIGRDGSVRGFPLSVNLQPYNVQSFPEIRPRSDDLKGGLRRRLSQRISETVDPGGSIVAKAVTFLNRYYLKEQRRQFTDVSALFPTAEYVDRATVDNVVFLQAAPNATEVSLEAISTEQAVTTTQAISSYEWNARLEEYFRAYDSLVPGGSAVERLTDVVEAERRVFAGLFDDVGTYRLSIPRESNWDETGIDSAVVDAVRSLEPRLHAAESD